MADAATRRAFLDALRDLGYTIRKLGNGRFALHPQQVGASETVLELPLSDWVGFVEAHQDPFDPIACAERVVSELKSSVRPIARAGVQGEAGVYVWFFERRSASSVVVNGEGWYPGPPDGPKSGT